MSTIFIDGFDKYGPVGNSSNNGNLSSLINLDWSFNYFGAFLGSIANGLSSTGTALAFNPNNGNSFWGIGLNLSTSYTRLIGGFRMQTAHVSDCIFQFLNNGNPMCAIHVDTSGVLHLETGGAAFNSSYSGTGIASGGSIGSGVTTYVEFDITFGSSGAYQIWLNGISLFSGTGNTANGQASCNEIGFGAIHGNTTLAFVVDDFYLFSSSGTTNNAVLNTNPRIETQYPTGDFQTQFSAYTALLGTSYSITTNTNAPGANTIFMRRYQAQVAMTLNSVSCVPEASNGTANFKAVVYNDSSGSPSGAALAVGGQVTGTTSGTTLTSTFSSGVSLTSGNYYWIGFITDTSVVLQETDTTSAGYSASNTYTSGAPTSPTMTPSQPSWNIWGNCSSYTVNHWAEAQNPNAGDLSAIQSSTAGNEDLYSYPALTTNPVNIYTMAVKCCARLSTSGTRTIDCRVSSSGTDSAGSNPGQTPTGSYAFKDSYFDTDPHTSAAWTTSGVNAAYAGPKCAS
jgi:hypothetical protein